jgi:lipid-A-disaccharide synthase-like uncharacterized protein
MKEIKTKEHWISRLSDWKEKHPTLFWVYYFSILISGIFLIYFIS